MPSLVVVTVFRQKYIHAQTGWLSARIVQRMLAIILCLWSPVLLLLSEAMGKAGSIKVAADDVALWVDAEPKGICGPWKVDHGERLSVKKESMGSKSTGAVSTIQADDVALRVDTVRLRKEGSGGIDGCESALVEDKSMGAAIVV